LDDILQDFRLQTANDPDNISFEERWTFQSCMGIKRQIDYIFCSANFIVKSSRSTNALDLGSDHRAVSAEIDDCPRSSHKHKPKLGRNWRPSPTYSQKVKQHIFDTSPATLRELQATLVDNAEASQKKTGPTFEKPWKSKTVRELVDQRRECRNTAERKRLSKLIFRESRRLSRIYQSQKAAAILADFNQLRRLKKIHHFPIVAEDVDNACEPESFAALLESVYSSNTTAEGPCKDLLREVPRFTLGELQAAMQKMKLGRCADQAGVVLEMVRAAPTIFMNAY